MCRALMECNSSLTRRTFQSALRGASSVQDKIMIPWKFTLSSHGQKDT